MSAMFGDHIVGFPTRRLIFFQLHLDLFITQSITTRFWITLINVGLFLLYVYTFYSCYNIDWIANMEIVLDPKNSAIKMLWCISHISRYRRKSVLGISDQALRL